MTNFHLVMQILQKSDEPLSAKSIYIEAKRFYPDASYAGICKMLTKQSKRGNLLRRFGKTEAGIGYFYYLGTNIKQVQ